MKLGSAICLVVSVGISGCSFSESAPHYLKRRAGIEVCSSAKVDQPSEAKDTREVDHFTFHVDGDCKAAFIRSVFSSSRGECAAMLPMHKSCMYEFKGGPTVLVEERKGGSDFKVTTF